MSAAHTPTPWSLRQTVGGGVIAGRPVIQYVNGKAQNQIAMTTGADWMLDGEYQANAAHIVRCVNAHDELVAALRAVIAVAEIRGAPDHYALIEARAAVAKATA